MCFFGFVSSVEAPESVFSGLEVSAGVAVSSGFERLSWPGSGFLAAPLSSGLAGFCTSSSAGSIRGGATLGVWLRLRESRSHRGRQVGMRRDAVVPGHRERIFLQAVRASTRPVAPETSQHKEAQRKTQNGAEQERAQGTDSGRSPSIVVGIAISIWRGHLSLISFSSLDPGNQSTNLRRSLSILATRQHKTGRLLYRMSLSLTGRTTAGFKT